MAEFAVAGGLAATMVSIGEVLASEVAWASATLYHQQGQPQSERSSDRPVKKNPGIYSRGNARKTNTENHPGIYRAAPETNRLANALEYLNQAVGNSDMDAPFDHRHTESPDLDFDEPCPTARLMQPVEEHLEMPYQRFPPTLTTQTVYYAPSFEACVSPVSKLHMTPRETLPLSGILSSSTSACSDSSSTAPYCDDQQSERSVISDDEWDDEQLLAEIEVKHLLPEPELVPGDSCLEQSMVPASCDRHLDKARASVRSAKVLSNSLDDDMGSLEGEMAELTRELMELQSQLAAHRSAVTN